MLKRAALLITGFLFFSVSSAPAQSGETRTFSGNVGDNRVQMTLRRDGSQLQGTYFYQKVGKDLKVSGAIKEDGSFTLAEFAPTGAKTGEFSGSWSKTESDDGYTLNGEWKNPGGTKTLEFFLTEQMIFFKSGARLTTRTFSEKNKPKVFELSAEYPELSGVSPVIATKFNQLAKAKALNELNKFRKDFLAQTAEDLKFARERGMTNTVEVSYNVAFADDEVISIWFGNYFYTGGAHPNGYTFTLNFDLKTGRELKLGDIFKPGADYLQVLSDHCVKALQDDLNEGREDEWIQTGAGAKDENYDSWNLTRKGIMVNFDAYQVAAYVAGPQEVLVPFEKVEKLLGKNYGVFKSGK